MDKNKGGIDVANTTYTLLKTIPVRGFGKVFLLATLQSLCVMQSEGKVTVEDLIHDNGGTPSALDDDRRDNGENALIPYQLYVLSSKKKD